MASEKHINGVSPSYSPTNIRLWRQAAQRNLKNQWSKLFTQYQQWSSSSSSSLSHAKSIANYFLSQSYIDKMELGVLSDMPDIKNKASIKLHKQQELHKSKLLSSYKDMVNIVIEMVNISKSMRCYSTKDSKLAQFSSFPVIEYDNGDGEGVSVFTFWSISTFEELAEELVEMLKSELTIKRLLVMALMSMNIDKESQLKWSDEFYVGEFNDLNTCKLLIKGDCDESLYPSLKNCKSYTHIMEHQYKLNHDVVQVYLTTWRAEVNINTYRVDEIFDTVGEEIHLMFQESCFFRSS